MERRCMKCHEQKELNTLNYGLKKSGKGGYDSICKACKKEKDAKRYALKREEILKQKKEYYQRKKQQEI